MFENQIFIDPLPCDISSIYSLLYNKTVRAHVTQARDNCEGPEHPADEAGPDQVVEPVQGRLVAVQRAWDREDRYDGGISRVNTLGFQEITRVLLMVRQGHFVQLTQ